MVTQRFNWCDFLRRVAVIAIPVALQNLLNTTASMIDTVMMMTSSATAPMTAPKTMVLVLPFSFILSCPHKTAPFGSRSLNDIPALKQLDAVHIRADLYAAALVDLAV